MTLINPGPAVSSTVNQAPGLSASWTDKTGTALSKPDGTSYSLLSVNPVVGNIYASDNTTLINSALSTYDIVSITAPGIYSINSTLIGKQGGNQAIYLGQGVTIKLANNANKALFKNWSWANGTEISVTSLTANDWVGNASPPANGTRLSVTAVTATAHGLAVGDYVSVYWAGSQGFGGVFRVETVANSTTFTYFPRVKPLVQTAPGGAVSNTVTQAKKCRKADQNIFFYGPGTFDQNAANNTSLASTGIEGFAIQIAHVENFQSTETGHTGAGNRDFGYWQCNNFKLIRTRGLSTVCHAQGTGGVSNVQILQPYGRGLTDDFVAVMLKEDAAFGAYQVNEGDVVGYRVEKMDCQTTETGPTPPIAVYGFSDKYQFSGIEIDGIEGYTARQSIKFTSVPVSGSTLLAQVVDCRIKNVNQEALIGMVSTDNFEFQYLKVSGAYTTTPSSNWMVFQAGAASGNIHVLDLSELTFKEPNNTTGFTVAISIQCACDVIKIGGRWLSAFSTGTNYLLGFGAGGSFNTLLYENLSGYGGLIGYFPATVTGGTIRLHNVFNINGGNLLDFDGATGVTVDTGTVVLSATGNYLRLRTNAAVTALGNTPTLGIATYYTATAGSTLTPKSLNVTVDPLATTINKVVGGMCNSSRATTSGGPSICEQGTTWYTLATGASGANTATV